LYHGHGSSQQEAVVLWGISVTLPPTSKTVIPEAVLIGNPDSNRLQILAPRYRHSGMTIFFAEESRFRKKHYKNVKNYL